MSDPIPKTLGRYEIGREVGRGMMGVVYEAVDPALGRRLALKTIRLAFEVPVEERESFEKRFLGEARAAGALQHPGIVVVHDVGRDEATGTLYIALELLEGKTMGEETARGKTMEWPRALRLTAQVAEALHHAHGQGIVHRDIKPTNIMVLASGQTKLMDFGIAKLPASQLTLAGEFFGTPSYMSPEQAGASAVDARSDLFSLGCVLYQLLTGRRAFDGETLPAILMRVMKEDPPPPSRMVEGIPPGVDAIVARLLAKDPDLRYPDGRSVGEDIEDVLAGRAPRHAPMPAAVGSGTIAETVPAPTTGTAVLPRDGAPPSRRRRLLLAAGGLALLTLGFLAALAVPWRGQPALLTVPTLLPVARGAVEIDFEHNLRSGSLKIWIDDDVVLEENLQGRVTQRVLSFARYKGSLTQTLDVPTGDHVVRVQVQGDGFSGSQRIRGTFESGVKRRLRAEVSGLVKRELSLYWGA